MYEFSEYENLGVGSLRIQNITKIVTRSEQVGSHETK